MSSREQTPRVSGDRQPVIELRSVEKSFGRTKVLDGVDLAIYPGETLVVLGPSGSGKSTLLRTINRLETIDAGEILYKGAPIPEEGTALAAYRAEVGMVFQAFNLYPHKTAIENVALAPVRTGRKAAAEARGHAVDLLARVNLADHGDKRPSALSGGQQQRVAIARALAMEPDLMLFDEPTSALDPEMIQEVLNVMKGLTGAGMTMAVVTHEIGFARSSADRVIFVDEGRIVEDCDPSSFFERPSSERARDFLSKILDH